jgi:hypothetical protein
MPASNKLAALVQWFDDNDVEWDKTLIEVRDTNGSLGVFAKKNIEEGLPGKEKHTQREIWRREIA